MTETPDRRLNRFLPLLKTVGIAAAGLAAIASIVAVVAALAGLNPLAALARTGHRLGSFAAATWPLWVLVAAGGAAVLLAMRAERRKPLSRRYWGVPERSSDEEAERAVAAERHARAKRAATIATALAVVATVPLGFLTIRSVNRFGHDAKHDAVVKTLIEHDGFAPAFAGRLPYPVVGRKLIDSVGEGGGITVEGIWRFDVAGTVKTCGLLLPEKNAWKRPVSGVVCIDDAGRVERAAFGGPQVPSWKAAGAKLRLAQVVNDLNPQSVFSASDIYGYIADGKPVMVVPTTKLCGGSRYVTGWAGAVVFDDNGARLVSDPAALFGPVGGESLANEVLGGLNHRGGFVSSRKNLGNFDATGNDANPTHHLLALTDGGGERLVTLLTPKGDSNTPVAALVIDPRRVAACGWPHAALYRFPAAGDGEIARASVAEAEQTVVQRYGAALQLENTKLVILETQLSGPGEVTVALGSDRQVLTYIAFDLQSRETVVYDRDRTLIRRDPANATVGPQGLQALFVADSALTSDGVPDSGTSVAAGELSELSDAQLAELLRRIADEVARRGN